MIADSEKDPAAVLGYLVGRPLSKSEVYGAFGLKRSAYYRALSEGRLITADNLIKAAKHFGLNPVDLQLRYGLVSASDVAELLNQPPPVATAIRKEVETKRPKIERLRERPDAPLL